MVNINTIQQEIASLPLEAQKTILELVDVLKKTIFFQSTGNKRTNNGQLV